MYNLFDVYGYIILPRLQRIFYVYLNKIHMRKLVVCSLLAHNDIAVQEADCSQSI